MSLTIHPRWRVAIAALSLLACSSGEPFDAAAVDLQGTWLLSDVTQPQGGTAPGGITNECRLRNVPVIIMPTEREGLWSARQLLGGTIACELNGVWSTPSTPPQELGFDVWKEGNQVQWVLASRFSYYVGTLANASKMSGTVEFEGYGREGTWVARRQGP
jgi:hypothetical protein